MPDRLQSERARRLLDLLGLTEDELCAALDVDPLTLLSGQLDHRPELRILLTLLDEAEERAGAAVLRRWVRAPGPAGRPIEALTQRNFAAFEDALGTLSDRGFVLRAGGRAGASGSQPSPGGDRNQPSPGADGSQPSPRADGSQPSPRADGNQPTPDRANDDPPEGEISGG